MTHRKPVPYGAAIKADIPVVSSSSFSQKRAQEGIVRFMTYWFIYIVMMLLCQILARLTFVSCILWNICERRSPAEQRACLPKCVIIRLTVRCSVNASTESWKTT
ncbi:hypothetical protein CDAR_274111 [Caerostris darwini]|uniref:Uncharacterized protein n=1 Tax=Caerostris darwini TaxID=1538125 RepID=A0AAV4RHI8_9ARAC|nr:hypothetical protein CDAR_274111 [Caerostris darwini]